MANHRVTMYQDKDNEEQLRLNLDLIDEVRTDAEERTTRYKNLMARQHDAMVKPRRFNIGDLVLKKVSLATKNPAHGKLGPNWEGPYRIINCKRQGSYFLEALDGRKLKHPWNVEHLRRYYQENASLNESSPGRAYMKRFMYVFVVCSTVLFYCYYSVIMDKVMDLLVCTYLLRRH